MSNKIAVVTFYKHTLDLYVDRLPQEVREAFNFIHINDVRQLDGHIFYAYIHLYTEGHYLDTVLREMVARNIQILLAGDAQDNPQIFIEQHKIYMDKLMPKQTIPVLVLENRLLVEQINHEEVRESGLIIPDIVSEHEKTGVVKALGIDFTDEERIKFLNQTIRYSKYAGQEVTYQRKTYILLRKPDIVAKVVSPCEEFPYPIELTENRILIWPDEPVKIQNGIVLPEEAIEPSVCGMIMDVADVKTLKVGDRVLYGKYSGTEITVGEEKMMILRETDISAIVE